MIPKFYATYKKLLSLTNIQLKPFSDSKLELEKSLKRTQKLLDYLKNPEKKLKFIHITGTSGKGSVANMLHQILLADGEKVGTYTSPHTTSYLERFQVNEKLINLNILTTSIDEVIKTYEKMLENGSDVLSFFELSTCIAIYAFEKAGVEWCVLEVGCGGKYDATNVIPTPRIAIITNINKDHSELLGNSLTEIAFEKAGIIKKNGIIFSGETRPALKKIFMDEAIKNNAALFFINPPTELKTERKFGQHQQHNAAIAEAAAKEINISDTIIDKALKSIKLLPCRFETIQDSPTVILDGAHSPAKIKSTVAMIKKLDKKPHIIFGCTATKDAETMIKELSKVASKITTTRFDSTMRKASNPFKLIAIVPKTKQAKAFLDWRDALQYVQSQTKKSDTIVITGSLYLAGNIRTHWITENQILKNQSSF